MRREMESLNKGMVLVVVVAEIISHAVQLQQLDKNQIGMNPLQGRNLRSIQAALREIINLVAVQHQVRGERILLMQDDVLVLDGDELLHRVQIGVLQIMADSIAAHHLLRVLVNALVNKDHVVMPLESK